MVIRGFSSRTFASHGGGGRIERREVFLSAKSINVAIESQATPATTVGRRFAFVHVKHDEYILRRTGTRAEREGILN